MTQKGRENSNIQDNFPFALEDFFYIGGLRPMM